jgi:hypothetical protein
MARRNFGAWTALLLAVALASPAATLDLDAAKRDGLLGERADGYVGVVLAEPAAELQALADDVNARRRAAYQEIARQNGTSIDAVAALAGRKLVERAPSGQWVTDASGRWYQKP